MSDSTPAQLVTPEPEVRVRRPHHRCPGPNCNTHDTSKWIDDGVFHRQPVTEPEDARAVFLRERGPRPVDAEREPGDTQYDFLGLHWDRDLALFCEGWRLGAVAAREPGAGAILLTGADADLYRETYPRGILAAAPQDAALASRVEPGAK